MNGYDWGMGPDGWLWMLLGLVLLVGIVVLIMRTMGGFNGAADRRRDSAPRPAPMDILRERFARGEITAAEFEQAKSVLGDDR